MTSPADHAATVRLADLLTEAFDARDSILHAEYLAEIVALADRATELEVERDQLLIAREDAYRRIGVAEARVTELERERYTGDDMAEAFQRGRLAERNERDSARQAAVAHMENLLGDERRRAVRAETALRLAQQRIPIWGQGMTDGDWRDAQEVLSAIGAALGETAPPEGSA